MSEKSHYVRGERSVSFGCDHLSIQAQACDTRETKPLYPGTWHFLEKVYLATQREWDTNFHKEKRLRAPPDQRVCQTLSPPPTPAEAELQLLSSPG